MDDTLHNLNDLMEALEGVAIHTSQGSFIKVEDARRLVQKRTEATAVEAATTPDPPKNMVQAKERAKEFLAKALPPAAPREPGRSVPASEPQPPSRA